MSSSYSFWILFLGLVQSVWNLMSVADRNEEMAGCVAQVALLRNPRKIALEYSAPHDDLVTKILKRVDVPVVLNSVEVRKATGIDRRTADDLVIMATEPEPDRLLEKILWNGGTRFLILADKREEVENYFRAFWKSRIINVFAMVRNEEEEISLESFLPYLRGNCSAVEVVAVDKCLEGKLTEGGRAAEASTRIRDMNGCPVNISMTEAKPHLIFSEKDGRIDSLTVRGFEGNLLQEFAKSYRMTPVFITSGDGVGWGWVKPSPRGAVGDVYRGVSEVGVGTLAPLMDRFENLDISTNYYLMECVTFVVPRGLATKYPAWISIYVLEFSFYTWVLIAFSFLSISINMWLINRHSNLNWFRGKTHLVMVLFSSFLGAPVQVPEGTSAKTSVASWIFFSFVVTLAYKASMGSKLTIPAPEVDINTLEELVASGLLLTGHKNFYNVLNNGKPVAEKMIKGFRFNNCSVEEVVGRIAEGEKLAYIRHMTTLYYYGLLNPKARERLHVLPDCLYRFPPVAILRKFSPFTNRISELVLRLEEAGIMKKWRTDYQYKIPSAQRPFISLSFRQMSAIFWFLCVGYTVSFLSLLGEGLLQFLKDA